MKKNEKGSISLEACIVVPIFIFLLLFFYGIMMMFSGEHLIANAMLQSGQSLSLDSYAINTFKGDSDEYEVSEFTGIENLVVQIFTSIKSNSNSDKFVAQDNWFDKGETAIQAECKERFLSYYANASNSIAEKRLHNAGVAGGISGLDFSESYIDEANGDLYLRLKYKQNFIFDFNGLASFDRKVEVVVHMWNWES